jgi:hypothetical protein
VSVKINPTQGEQAEPVVIHYYIKAQYKKARAYFQLQVLFSRLQPRYSFAL